MDLDIGGNIIAILEAKGISQKELSEATGIRESNLSKMISKGTISVKNLIKIANALYCTTDKLLGRK